MPDISFIVSNYNSADYLDGLLVNLSHQSHQEIEIIVVDSKSTDNSLEIVYKHQERDSRIKLIAQPQRTPYGVSWLIGWQAAKGKVVGNSNTDDRSYPWRATQIISTQQHHQSRDQMLRWKKYRFYYGGYETRRDGVTVAKGLPPPYSVDDMRRFFRCGVHVHWDNDLRDIVNWDVMMKAGYEYKSAFDYWLVLYFMTLGVEGMPIQNCFSIYNQRSDSIEQMDKERNTFESMRAIQTLHPEAPSLVDLETKTKFESPEFYKRYQQFLVDIETHV